ncbi:MAG TPA: ABC transporter ATP-binding protein [Candidatus Dormibacteraeota bacterium]|jgi:ABC-type multidrug transport system ATPase subunit|nr:ABC transporter ATP-binding protein [Candidatus Dormibacteraeota bacterium]
MPVDNGQRPEEASIIAKNLVRRFGDFVAVDGVSFRVDKGEIFGFLGPNGSGKTTVIKMLTGLLPLSEGSAWVEGLDVRTDAESVRERIGYMSQKFSLYDDLTVTENLQFYGRIYGLTPARMKRRIEEIVQLNGLGPYMNRLAARLSGGWKQRLALGCAMLHEPKLLFLDEPTAGIDPVARRELWDLLFELSGHGITFFVTTHYMDEAERCSHVAYIYYGKLIADGTPAELKKIPDVQPAGTKRLEISTPEVTRALRVVRKIPGIRSATIFGESIHALVEDRYDLSDLRAQLLKNDITVNDIRPLTPSLEDVFVELTYKYQAQLETARE